MGVAPPNAAPAADEEALTNSNSSANEASIITTQGVPSNISIVEPSKEEGAEKVNGQDGVQEFDYPDGGLRGRHDRRHLKKERLTFTCIYSMAGGRWRIPGFYRNMGVSQGPARCGNGSIPDLRFSAATLHRLVYIKRTIKRIN